MYLVRLTRPEYGFFDRQRDLFEEELARARREMHQLHQVAEDTNKALGIDNPFVTDNDGNKKLSLRFDCSKFKPEEVEVKVKDNNLIVHAKHDEVSDGKEIHREFHRQYMLPDIVDKEQLKAELAEDGVLSIHAPVPQLSVEAPKEQLIPITKM